MLWKELKGGQLHGLSFRKQHPVGPYILDFYCAECRLAVEIDGDGHGFGDRPERDAWRDAWLAGQGVQTLRLPAVEIMNGMAGALENIADAALRRRSTV